MFKSKEELIEEYGPEEGDENATWDIREYGAECINKAFKSFAERVEFYKKYKDNPLELQSKETAIFLKWLKLHNEGDFHTQEELDNDFNDWLFDYCFGGLI